MIAANVKGRFQTRGKAKKNPVTISAGGNGAKMGTGLPKHFIEENGKAIIIHAPAIFRTVRILKKLILQVKPVKCFLKRKGRVQTCKICVERRIPKFSPDFSTAKYYISAEILKIKGESV